MLNLVPFPAPFPLTVSFLLSSVDALSDHILGHPHRHRSAVIKEEADHLFRHNASIYVALQRNQMYN